MKAPEKHRITIKMREIADIAEQLPTGLIDKNAIKKMNREAGEMLEAANARDRVGFLMEAGDVVYYAVKAFYNGRIDHGHISIIIELIASFAGIMPELLLDICIAKMSLRTRDGNPKDDAEERAAVMKVLEEVGPHAY